MILLHLLVVGQGQLQSIVTLCVADVSHLRVAQDDAPPLSASVSHPQELESISSVI